MTILKLPVIKDKYAELVIFGDMHYGCHEQDRTLVKKMIDYVLQTNETAISQGKQPYCYAVTVGDTLDNAIKGKFGTIGHDKSVGEAYLEFKEDFETLLKKKYFVAACPGNHDSRIAKALGSEFDPIQQHLEMFGAKYGDPNLILYWIVGDSSFTGLVSHGSGGGGTAGTVANNMMKQINELSDFDWSAQGHFHRFMYTSNLRPYLKIGATLGVGYQVQHFFTVGACLKKSYYAREARMAESPTSGLILKFQDRKNSRDKKTVKFEIIQGDK